MSVSVVLSKKKTIGNRAMADLLRQHIRVEELPMINIILKSMI